jgi:hypothetical protein
MSKKKQQPGFTRQGVRDLSYMKSKPAGIRLPLPPDGGMQCDHHGTVREIDAINGISQCSRCKTIFDFDGCII